MSCTALSEDQLEVFQELINVAYGTATASIANIINAHATLAIPEITIILPEEVYPYLTARLNKSQKYYICKQPFYSNFSGESVLVIGDSSATNLAKAFELEDDELDESNISEILLELTNILSSATIGTLSEQTNTSASFSPPEIEVIGSFEEIDQQSIICFNQVVVISTVLSFKQKQIYAEYMLLSSDKPLQNLQEALQKIVDELL